MVPIFPTDFSQTPHGIIPPRMQNRQEEQTDAKLQCPACGQAFNLQYLCYTVPVTKRTTSGQRMNARLYNKWSLPTPTDCHMHAHRPLHNHRTMGSRQSFSTLLSPAIFSLQQTVRVLLRSPLSPQRTVFLLLYVTTTAMQGNRIPSLYRSFRAIPPSIRQTPA